MNPHHLPNPESTLNSLAYVVEFAKWKWTICFLIAAVLVGFLRRWRLAFFYLLLLLIAPLLSPEFVNQLVAKLTDAYGVQAAQYCPAIIITLLFMQELFYISLPVRIGKQKNRMGEYARLCALSLVFPPFWSIAVYRAHKDNTTYELGQSSP